MFKCGNGLSLMNPYGNKNEEMAAGNSNSGRFARAGNTPLENEKSTGGGEDADRNLRRNSFIYQRGVRYRGRPTTSSVDWVHHPM